MRAAKSNKTIFAAVIIGIIGVIALAAMAFLQQGDPQQAASTVKGIYDLQYETNSEILGVEENNGLYKVTIRFTDFSGQNTTNDVFVTKNGRLIAERLIISENYVQLLTNQKNFAECLSERGVRIIGQVNDTATLQQLNILGNYAYKLFVSCDGPNEAVCANFGVQRYPTAVFNDTGYDNVYPADFFSQLTGCPLG